MVEQQNRHGAGRSGDVAGDPLTFTFEGDALIAYPGDTVASAALAAGIRTFTITEVAAEPRGGYCFAGRCSDCLVVIDGQANQRACTTPVRPGMSVKIQRGLGPVASGDAS